MKTGFEMEILLVLLQSRHAATGPLICVGFDGLHGYLIGNIMFPFAVRPGQSGSNQVRVGQTIRSSEARERRVLAAEVIKGCEMARFDATLLVR